MYSIINQMTIQTGEKKKGKVKRLANVFQKKKKIVYMEQMQSDKELFLFIYFFPF